MGGRGGGGGGAGIEKQILGALSADSWTSLATVRDKLGGTRAGQDAALRQMFEEGKIRLIPESNQKTLTAAQRAAAITVGDQLKHLIQLRRR